MKKITLIALFVISFVGCQNDDSTPPVVSTDPVNIAFEEVFRHDFAGEESVAAGTFVINDAVAWQALIATLNAIDTYDPQTGETTNLLEAVNVDFSAFTVIAVVDQLHPNSGFGISVTNVTEADGAVAVTVTTTGPDPGNVMTILSQPYHIVKIPKTTLPVTFITEQ